MKNKVYAFSPGCAEKISQPIGKCSSDFYFWAKKISGAINHNNVTRWVTKI